MSDLNEIKTQVDSLLTEISNISDDLENEFDRLQVALTGSLRLLDESNATTLSALQGTPNDLKNYLITLVSELKQKTQTHLRHLTQSVNHVLEANKSQDRKH